MATLGKIDHVTSPVSLEPHHIRANSFRVRQHGMRTLCSIHEELPSKRLLRQNLRQSQRLSQPWTCHTFSRAPDPQSLLAALQHQEHPCQALTATCTRIQRRRRRTITLVRVRCLSACTTLQSARLNLQARDAKSRPRMMTRRRTSTLVAAKVVC